MGSFVRKAGGIGAAMLAGAALTAVPSAAQAAKAEMRYVRVPCGESALAQAINTANNLTVPTVLWLQQHCTYSYLTDDLSGTAGDALPQIKKDITLAGGPSTTIERATGATEKFRILDVVAGATLHVKGLSILGGDPASAMVEEGGGIRNAGTLVLKYVTLAGNTAGSTTAPMGGNGGGLSNLTNAQAFVANTLITGNRAVANGNATGAGGGILNRGTLKLLNSRLTLNTADDGGGGLDTLLTPGTSIIIQSTIDRNIVPAGGTGGAGIFNSGTTKLYRSLVTRNNATSTTLGGGGIYNYAGNTTLAQSIVGSNDPNNCAPLNTIAGCTN